MSKLAQMFRNKPASTKVARCDLLRRPQVRLQPNFGASLRNVGWLLCNSVIMSLSWHETSPRDHHCPMGPFETGPSTRSNELAKSNCCSACCFLRTLITSN